MELMPRILIIEDDTALSRALNIGLGKEGIDSTIANNGEEALKMLEKDRAYDLVLLDLLMPNMSGFRFLEELYSSEITIPIIVSTNSQEMQHKYKAERYGVVQYMIKAETPLWLLIDKIKEILKLSPQDQTTSVNTDENPEK